MVLCGSGQKAEQERSDYFSQITIKPLDKVTFSPHVPPPCAIGVLPGRGKPNYVQPTS